MDTRIAELIDAIRDHSPAVEALLARFDDICFHDAHGLSPLNAAIRYGNAAAFEALIEHKSALTYAPELSKADRQLLRHMSAEMGTPIQDTEAQVAKTFGEPPEQRNWMRTPLLEACRYGNREAMAALIGYGAKLNDKDALGASASQICLDVGGGELLHAYVDACIAHGRPFPVDTLFLQQAQGDSALAEKLARYGKLDAKAKRFRFNLACALLDVDTVDAMLADGHDVAKSVVSERNPIDEAATSSLLWTYKHPDAQRLARPLRRFHDKKPAARINGADIAAAVDAARAWLDPHDLPHPADARREWNVLARIEAARPTDLDPEPIAPEELERRLELIDRLIAAGGDTARTGHDLLSSAVLSNTPELLAKLIAVGIEFDPYDAEDAIGLALAAGCFRMIEPLSAMGLALEPLRPHRARAYIQYRQWCAEQGQTPLEPPRTGGETEGNVSQAARFRDGFKAIADSPLHWELGGESTLQAATLPASPRAGETTAVRLTHSNVYWPIDDVQFAVRIGDPNAPTPFDAANTVDGWQPLPLVEELVDIEGEIIPREEADDDEMLGEVPWDGTFETSLRLPVGRSLIEIRICAPDGGSIPSGVIADWAVDTEG